MAKNKSRMSKKSIFYIALIVVVMAVSFGAGAYFFRSEEPEFAVMQGNPMSGNIDSLPGFLPVNVSFEGTSILLSNDCRGIMFDVTEDQAYSIAQGIGDATSERPLTHDIFNDVLENYDINITKVIIDRYEDEIFKARIYFAQGDKMLEIDARPSDTIAMSVRTNKTLFVDSRVMENNSIDICAISR
jgi:uncharacterized protein